MTSAPRSFEQTTGGKGTTPASDEPNGEGGGAEASPPTPAVANDQSEASASEPEATATEVSAELAVERARAQEFLALAQRSQADFENYRKRMAREAALAEARGVVRLAKELLPALDHLDLALASADAEGEGSGHLAEGIRLVRSELHAALKRAGIAAFSPAGEPFDPECHEAVAAQPAADVAPGTVIEVYQQGYRHNDSVLRPARVVVSAAAEQTV